MTPSMIASQVCLYIQSRHPVNFTDTEIESITKMLDSWETQQVKKASEEIPYMLSRFREIANMPHYDQDDAHRLRHKAQMELTRLEGVFPTTSSPAVSGWIPIATLPPIHQEVLFWHTNQYAKVGNLENWNLPWDDVDVRINIDACPSWSVRQVTHWMPITEPKP